MDDGGTITNPDVSTLPLTNTRGAPTYFAIGQGRPRSWLHIAPTFEDMVETLVPHSRAADIDEHILSGSKRGSFLLLARSRDVQSRQNGFGTGKPLATQRGNENIRQRAMAFCNLGTGTAVIGKRKTGTANHKIRKNSLLLIEKENCIKSKNTGRQLLQTLISTRRRPTTDIPSRFNLFLRSGFSPPIERRGMTSSNSMSSAGTRHVWHGVASLIESGSRDVARIFKRDPVFAGVFYGLPISSYILMCSKRLPNSGPNRAGGSVLVTWIHSL